jgi:hypothetical protein
VCESEARSRANYYQNPNIVHSYLTALLLDLFSLDLEAQHVHQSRYQSVVSFSLSKLADIIGAADRLIFAAFIKICTLVADLALTVPTVCPEVVGASPWTASRACAQRFLPGIWSVM